MSGERRHEILTRCAVLSRSIPSATRTGEEHGLDLDGREEPRGQAEEAAEGGRAAPLARRDARDGARRGERACDHNWNRTESKWNGRMMLAMEQDEVSVRECDARVRSSVTTRRAGTVSSSVSSPRERSRIERGVRAITAIRLSSITTRRARIRSRVSRHENDRSSDTRRLSGVSPHENASVSPLGTTEREEYPSVIS